MDKVKQYRRRAQECCELAAQVTVPDVRVNYEELAAMWDRLADAIDHFFGSLSGNFLQEMLFLHRDVLPKITF
jgi:hypothetical protein